MQRRQQSVTIGAWRVDWEGGWIIARGRFWAKRRRPDARLMAVLSLLSDNAGQPVSTEEILEVAWPDRVVSRDSVSTAIYQLRQLLNDNAQQPSYIRTQGRRGYQLIAPVRRKSELVKLPVTFAATAGALIVLFGATAWVQSNFDSSDERVLLVESLQDKTDDPTITPLTTAIGSTLFGELIVQLPGQVTAVSDSEKRLLKLQSQVVACDLGPALVVQLLDTANERYVWSQAYRLNDTPDNEPTLVKQVAADVGEVVRAL